MCLYPRMIKNKRYEPNKKNDGIVPVVLDTRALFVPRKCERCIECKQQKARDWMIRLQEDIKTNTNAKFITLTFSNEGLTKALGEVMADKPTNWDMKGYELDNAIATKAVRMWNERHRKKYKKACRHWLITELGHQGTDNIHMHGIIWMNENMISGKGKKQQTIHWTDELAERWGYGWVWTHKMEGEKKINYVNNRTVNYITKYVTKTDELYKHYTPIILSSPGIGSNYTNTHAAIRNKYNGQQTRNYYRTENGYKMSLPKYWKNKIYNDEEREQLWMATLDKNKMYVCGEEIDVRHTKDRYFETVKYYRKKNRRLGYGSYHKDEDRLEWEENRRAKKFMERITRAETDFWWIKH